MDVGLLKIILLFYFLFFNNRIIIFLQALRDDHKIIDAEGIKRVEGYRDKVQGIRDVLKRDHMKVAFFGRYTTFQPSAFLSKIFKFQYFKI